MAGAVSALFLLDIKGRVLVWRDYRGDVSALQAERFFTKLLDKEGDAEVHSPVVYDDGRRHVHVHPAQTTSSSSPQPARIANAASILLFLHRVVDVFKHYFEELEESRSEITLSLWYGKCSSTTSADSSVIVLYKPPHFVSAGLLDVVESVNILVNSNGQIVRSDVVGALKMRTYLRFYAG
ncbi:AP-1 complex subunit mu-2-like [Panicum virgatum]|uniref:AP-1 complex subunit mu-2-like n=1 Tax=Panicum virgatum TaxID=38727 RepID=UPI0019D626E2|nr:AP-1 complex subunit mu-2-like [Panicum virgatum]